MSATTSPSLPQAHQRALALHAGGDHDGALTLLREAMQAAVDPEALNDLAVMMSSAGDENQALALLRAAVSLHPEHEDAAANLMELERSGPNSQPDAADEATRRFLQVIADTLPVTLPDNIDYLFEPYGRKLPEPGELGARIAENLDLVRRARTVREAFGDTASLELFYRFFAYRALGPAHVRLQLEPETYRQSVIALTARAMIKAAVVPVTDLPFEWQFHQYDLAKLGMPIEVVGPPLPLASTMIFSQYAYRDRQAGARPRPGDVAVDVGGCWGDTALWLAHVVGAEGRVHTFEPTPDNRRLLEQNLRLNPHLASRISVHGEPLTSGPGETVWIPDVLAAGAALQEDPHSEHPLVQLKSASIDQLVANGTLDRVDFLKVDVEGADLGVLEGAADTIRSQQPRLALACYHKPDDLIVLPEFLASLGVRYRWYLQCSTMTDIDTVAFAVPESS